MKLFAALLILTISTMSLRGEQKTISDRVAEFSDAVQARLVPSFVAAGVAYPPTKITMVAIKQDRRLELYAAGDDDDFRFVRAFPILAASGELGPKLKEGDRQVPEGIYRIRELNPNSLYHLSLWLDYPNDFDQARASEDGRTELGSEIMIHGSDQSRGCLAMGDEAAEDLFVLSALTGIENVTAIVAPVDFRQRPFDLPKGAPVWTSELYQQIAKSLAPYRVTEAAASALTSPF